MTTDFGKEYPLISIVCVVKNGDISIKRAIDSILAQDYPNIEIIVQDAASTDGTLEILRGYGDKIKLVSEADSNSAEGSLRAFSRITGEFLGTCSDDEVMLPHAVSWGVKNLQDNPDLAAVYGDSHITNIKGEFEEVRKGGEFDLAKVFCLEVVPPYMCAFFRTSHFRQIQFSDPIEACIDFEIWLKLGMKFPIKYIEETVMKNSRHVGSQTCQSATYASTVQSKKRIMDHIFDEPATPDAIKSLRDRAHSGLYLWAVKSLLAIHRNGYEKAEGYPYCPKPAVEIARGHFLEAIKYDAKSPRVRSYAQCFLDHGVELYNKGMLKEALSFMQVPLKTNLIFLNLNYLCAVVLGQLERFDEAITAVKRELQTQPDHAGAKELLQKLLTVRGGMEKEIKNNPDLNASGKMLSGLTGKPLGNRDGNRNGDEVKSNKIKQAIEMSRSGRFEDALCCLDQVAYECKDKPSYGLHGLRAMCLQRLGRNQDAIKALREELKFFPDNKSAQKILDQLGVSKQISDTASDSDSTGSSMNLQKYVTHQPVNSPPQSQGWTQFWHGYHQMDKVRSDKKRKKDDQDHTMEKLPANVMPEDEFEQLLFLNIIANIDKDHINMFELGAGRGDWCLSLAGVVDFQLIPQRAKTYRCLALEGEPTHFQWTKEHFDFQNINGVAVHGAVQDHNGVCRFSALAEPADSYGQYAAESGNIIVPCFTIDKLMADHNFEHIDIIHMDVQGAEYEALLGAASAFERGAIDYILLETHTGDMNQRIMDLVGHRYNCVVDIPRSCPLVDTPLGKASFPVGGIMLLQRKGVKPRKFKTTENANSLPVKKKSQKAPPAEMGSPLLSIVAATRNDDHGGDALGRTQMFIDGVCAQSRRHCLKTELVIVEWNPPAEKPPLKEAISLPVDNDYCTVRIITVPSEIHQQYEHADALPLYQMIAKNVGIRRAVGEFVLTTNVDILFSDELFEFFASGKMTRGKMYRANRFDVEKGVLEKATMDEQLAYCQENIIRINKIDGTKNIRTGDYHAIYTPNAVYKKAKLNTNTSGDFQMMHRDHWHALRGYAEFDMYSFYLDSIFEYMAHFGGAPEETLPDPMRIYHIEHNAGWSPESHKKGVLWDRLSSSNIKRLTNAERDVYVEKMSAEQKPIIFNDENWGHAKQNFIESRPKHTGWDIEQDALVIVVDIHDGILADSDNAPAGWESYYEKKMTNLCSMLEHCNDNNIKTQEALYYGTRHNRLGHIKFDYTLDDELDYSKFSHIYFCGISLDQCVVSRPLGYFNLKHQRKTVLKNCSLQGLKYMGPINYGIAKQHGAEVGRFESMKQLHEHVDRFLRINSIDTENRAGAKDEKYLSVVVTSRNDDHGGNTLHRTQAFARGLAEQCKRFELDAELIVVDWNPPADRKKLHEVIDWPEDLGPLTVRFIEVPKGVHDAIGNSDKFPLFQMIAKNVGIQRAKGKFVLATNIDILLNDELMQFLASGKLDENSFYRIDRHDTYNKTIPMDMGIAEQLEFCKNSLVRVQGLYGTKKISEMQIDHFKYSDADTKLHANACGDFTLMAREKWFQFRAYPELPLWSLYVDGLLLHMAHVSKMKQVILPEPMRIYHIEHGTGWKVIPETVKQRPTLDYNQQYLPWCKQMIDQGNPLTNNDENWGYAAHNFKEHVIASNSSGLTNSVTVKEYLARTNSSLIEKFSNETDRLYFRDQSVDSLNILTDLVAKHKPTKIVELGTLSGMSLRTWIAAGNDADIVAVDLSFDTLERSRDIAPLDLSNVTLVEQDILKTDFTKFWSQQDKVLLYVDAHDLEGVPIIDHMLDNAIPSMSDGSIIAVDDMWYCPDAVSAETVTKFFDHVTTYQVDSLQSFEGWFAPYWKGGFFIGFREVAPLLEWINRHKVELKFAQGDKAVMFEYSKAVASSQDKQFDLAAFNAQTGVMQYKPLDDVRVLGDDAVSQQAANFCQQAKQFYDKGRYIEAIQCFRNAVAVTENIYAILYVQAMCLAKAGQLEIAARLLELEMKQKMPHPRAAIVLGDIERHMNKSQSQQQPEAKQQGMTIFAIPKAFQGHTAIIQNNAIKSWTKLTPKPEIILFGNEDGTKEIAQELGLTHVPDIKCNEYGTPLIDHLFKTTETHTSNDIIAYVNSDIILFNDFIDSAVRVKNNSDKFLMVGQHWDIDVPYHVNFEDDQWSQKLLEQIRSGGKLHAPTGIDYFVFKKGLWPTIPPFAIGRTVWDNWLVGEALRQGAAVIDVTNDVTVIHQEHSYAHLSGGKDEAWNGPEAKKNHALAGSDCSMRSIADLSIALVDGEFASNVVRQNQKSCSDRPKVSRIKEIEPPKKQLNMQMVGSDYGGWAVDLDLIPYGSVVISAGIGEDISFDKGMIERRNCQIIGVDPTEKAASFIKNNSHPNFFFVQKALCAEGDKKIKIYKNTNPEWVSESIIASHHSVDLSDYYEAETISLNQLLQQCQNVSVLKMDIEGAEYEVLNSIERLNISQICIEFHHVCTDFTLEDTLNCIDRLRDMGYVIAHKVEKGGKFHEITFVHKRCISGLKTQTNKTEMSSKL